MKLQAKFALYNAIIKITTIIVLGTIILLSLETIATHHLDARLTKKRSKVIANLNDAEIDSLLRNRRSFTDYNILKEEFIVLNVLPKNKILDTAINFSTERREIESDVEIYRILTDQFEYNHKRYQLELGETMTAMESIRSTVRFYMLIVLIITLLVTLITDYAFTNLILKPFYQIIDRKLNRVNDPISYRYENIPTNTTDFKILDESINSLMRKINDLFLLEKQFIANVSHELLTPISVLGSRLENMLVAEDLPVIHEDKILASLKTLSRLKLIINSLLLISKVENEQYLKKDEVYLGTELEEIYEELEDRIIAKKITYSNHVASNQLFIGNRGLIQTLLLNIINNAVKYNKVGGTIEINEVYAEHQYQLVIIDNGIGMDDKAVINAFNRFERANVDENEEGYGLGLSIANSIAKFHGIKIEIRSELGKGTTVTISFPC